ncbi:MAG: hypothetical protein R3C05_02555 [Pirellulaceae bacterium]
MVYVLLIVSSLHVVAAEGTVSDPWDRFDLRGNQTFQRRQIIDALIGNERFLLAVHPHADVTQLAGVVQELLTSGYRQAGFVNPKIDVTTDEATGRVKVQIQEGLRFRCGDVSVEGAESVDVKSLVARLTLPFPDEKSFPAYAFVDGRRQPIWVNAKGEEVRLQDAVWERDAWCSFAASDSLNRKVATAFADLGFSNAKFSISVNPDKDSGDQTVQLRVVIDDEGEPDRIDDIVVTGIKKHSHVDIARFLELERGDVIHRGKINAINEKLWESGRFSKQRVDILRRDDPRTLELRIELEEAANVPHLTTPISEEAEAFMQARRWISQLSGRGQDLVIEGGGAGQRLMFIHSTDGLLVKLEVPNPDGDQAVDGFFAMLLDRDHTLICFSPLKCKYHGRSKTGERYVRLSAGIGAAQKDDAFINQTVGFQISTNRKLSHSLVEFSLNLQPSGFLPFAYKTGIEHQWSGDILTSKYRDNTVRIDRTTGEVSMHLRRTELKFQKNRLQKERFLLLRQTESMPQAYDESSPLGSLATYLCDPAVLSSWSAANLRANVPPPAIDPHFLAALQKFFAAGLLKPLDSLALAVAVDDEDFGAFGIVDGKAPMNAAQGELPQIVAKFGLKYVSKAFPEQSWPLLVIRESCLVVLGHRQFTGDLLQRIHDSDKYGPICHATIAWLVGYVQPQLRPRFALRGAATQRNRF